MSLRICLAALLVAILALLLSELGFRQKRLLTTLALVIIFSLLGDGIARVLSALTSISELEGLAEATKCAIKAVGLGYLFGFAADLCEEMGERGIASAVTVCARVEIFVVALPYFEKTIKLGVELLQ